MAAAAAAENMGQEDGPNLQADREEQQAGFDSIMAHGAPLGFVVGASESWAGATSARVRGTSFAEGVKDVMSAGLGVRGPQSDSADGELSFHIAIKESPELPPDDAASSVASSPSDEDNDPSLGAAVDVVGARARRSLRKKANIARQNAGPSLEPSREEVTAAFNDGGDTGGSVALTVAQRGGSGDVEFDLTARGQAERVAWVVLKVLPVLIFAGGITVMAYKVRFYTVVVVWFIYVVSCYSFFAFEGFDHFEGMQLAFVFGLSGILALTQWVAEDQHELGPAWGGASQLNSSNVSTWGQHPYQLREIDRCMAAESGSVSTRWLGGARNGRTGAETSAKTHPEGWSSGAGLQAWEEREHDWLSAFILQQLAPVVVMSLLTCYMLTMRISVAYAVYKEEELKKWGMVYENEAMDAILSKCIPDIVLNSMRLGQLPTISGLGTIMFADLVSFTPFSSKLTPLQLAQFLNEM
jgi:hypothetical protein